MKVVNVKVDFGRVWINFLDIFYETCNSYICKQMLTT